MDLKTLLYILAFGVAIFGAMLTVPKVTGSSLK